MGTIRDELKKCLDWNQVLQRITEMHEYFRGCLDNAAPGSEAEQRFGEYCGALLILELMVRDKIEEDGQA